MIGHVQRFMASKTGEYLRETALAEKYRKNPRLQEEEYVSVS